MRRIQYSRRATQTLSFCFLLYLMLQAVFPLESKIPVDLYLRLDPLIGLITVLTQGHFILRVLPAFGVLLLVIVFGNFFCGWFCPLGATIDLFDRILFRERKRPKGSDERPLRRLRYGVFLFSIIAGVMAFQVIYLLDPISLITRTLVISFYPPAIFTFDNLLPGMQMLFPSNHFILSTLSVPIFQVNLLIFAAFITILALGVIRKRFWCRYLCPLGTLFSISTRLRMLRRTVSEDCTDCLQCMRECSIGAIPKETPQQYRQQDCISCFKCLECPAGAVSFKFRSPAWGGADGVNLSRRYVLGSLALGCFSALTVKIDPGQTGSGVRNDRLIRPPGALPEKKFVSVCAGCGECLKVCPNNALQSTLFEAGLAGLFTPRLVPRIGYCEESCNFCGRVCPTEAILPLRIEKKRLLQLGIAHIDKTRCIAWDAGKICLICNEHCSYHAIVPDEKKRPIVKEDICRGCGICENKCPVDGEAAIIVNSLGVQKELKPEPPPNG